MGYQLKVRVYIERAWKIWELLLYCTYNRQTDHNSLKEVITWYLFSWLLCICRMFMYADRNIIYFMWVQNMITTLSEEHRLRMYKNWVLRRWSNSRMKTLHNDDLHDFYSVSDIIRMIKSQVWNPQCMWPTWVI